MSGRFSPAAGGFGRLDGCVTVVFSGHWMIRTVRMVNGTDGGVMFERLISRWWGSHRFRAEMRGFVPHAIDIFGGFHQ